MRTFFVALIAAMSCGAGSAQAADETLKFFLSQSQFALAGELLAEPVKHDKPFRWWGDQKQPPLTVYEIRIKVLEQFQYQIAPYPHKEMTAYVLMPEGAERPDPLKKGAKCIFFLNWVYGGPAFTTSFITADPWFGVQRYDPKMAERLTAQGKRPPKIY
jgi:hypothetical protein